MARRRSRGTGAAPPLVVAVLLQHGAQPVPSGARAAAEDLAGFGHPRLPIAVDDLSAASEAAVRARGLTPLATLALLCLALPGGLGRDATLAALDRWSDLLRALDADDGPPPPEDALATLCWYLADTTELTKEEVDMTVARKVVLDIAYPGTGGEKLRQQWFAEGKTEGKAEGLAEALVRQLTRRFGALAPEVVARVQSGSIRQLQSWCDRVVDAPDLAAVFAD